MNEILCIYKTNDATEADLIKSQFEANGILCFLRTDNAGGALPYLTMTNGVREVAAVEGLMQVCCVLFAVDDAELFYAWRKRFPHMLFWPKTVQTGMNLRKWVIEGIRARR